MKRTPKQIVALLSLDAAEVEFLKAFGWKRAMASLKTRGLNDYWMPPKGFPTRNAGTPHRQGHALAAQKWLNSVDG